MEESGPLSPSPSNILIQADDDLQQLIQHDAVPTHYGHPEQQTLNIGGHMGSNTHSRYSSPGPQTTTINTYEHHTPIHHVSPYAPPSYTGGYHAVYPVDPSPYPQLPDVGSSTNSHNAYSTPATSPPTPVPIEGMMTRSGRAITRPVATTTLTRPARIEKAPPKARTKKRKRAIGDAFPETPAISLPNPLSVLVKNITNITDTDIEAYVNRSPEDRRLEVEQSKTGKVKRPMNAFMLYRKAYQNRTKEWKRLEDIRRKEESANEGKPEKGHDNHQVISQVCGLSWNIEPQVLRDQYDEWAKIERSNHKLAFPEYKFAPAKSKVKKPASGGGGGSGGGGAGRGGNGSRRGDRDSDEDNASNLDAYDFNDWGHAGSGPPSRNATRSARFHDPDAEYLLPQGYPHPVYTSPSPGIQTNRLPAGAYGTPVHYGPPPPHPSSYHQSNPGKPRPLDYGSTLVHAQYYPQSSDFVHQQQPQQQVYHAHLYPGGGGGGPPYQVHHSGIPGLVESVYMRDTNSPAPSLYNSPAPNHHTYNEQLLATTSYAPQHISPHPHPHPHPHAQIQQQHLQAHHRQLQQQQQHPLSRHPPPPPEHHHQIDPSLMRVGNTTQQDAAFDALEMIGLGHDGDFTTDGLSTYQFHPQHQPGTTLVSTAHHQLESSSSSSSHPQQFEQVYHTLGVGGDEATPDLVSAAADVAKLGPSDWETALGEVGEFALDDIDQILGTTTDSLGG